MMVILKEIYKFVSLGLSIIISTKKKCHHNRWLVRHGDIATLDADGYMTICDRAKDLIKSGGEWISSVELENIAVGHPEIVWQLLLRHVIKMG